MNCIRKTVLRKDGRQPMLYVLKYILLHININIKFINYIVISNMVGFNEKFGF